MSEYQYYEFRAIDKPLTRDQMAELRKVSSRGSISAKSYVNEYEWGDFKGDPDQWIDCYFDAFLYYANWGTKVFKLKIPHPLLSEHLASEYESDCLGVRESSDAIVITFCLEPYDSPQEWEDYDGMMGSLIGLRSELAQGDCRSLYLGWLIDRSSRAEYCGDFGEELEPPVPPGLRTRTASQQALVDFFEIDIDLLMAAAAASPDLRAIKSTEVDHKDWLSTLPESEKDEYLLRVLSGAVSQVGLELNAKFLQQRRPGPASSDQPRRTLRELTEMARSIQDRRLKEEQIRRDTAKKLALDKLLSKLPATWDQVEAHADSKKVNEYATAVALLVEIRELARRGDVPNFDLRVMEFRARHSTKRALLDRMTRVGL